MTIALSKTCSRSSDLGISFSKTQRLLVSPSAIFFGALLVLLALCPRATYCQAFQTPSPGCYASLGRAKLVSAGTGWATVNQPLELPLVQPGGIEDCTTEHLYWTDNDGLTWREITPRQMPTKDLGIIYFLDRAHGWCVSSNGNGEENNDPIYVLSTANGGKSWHVVRVPRPMVSSGLSMFPTDVFFSDPNHGWILWRWAMMNSRINALTATTDGGRTWKTLPQPPGRGPMQFTSELDGWLVGASAGQVGVPVSEDDQLWATHDGGKNWNALSVSVPADSSDDIRFGALKFDAAGNGVLVAESRVSDYVDRFFTCVTHDGGTSWQFSHFDEYQAHPSLLNMDIIWTIFHWPASATTIRAGETVISPKIPDSLALNGNLGDVVFIDQLHAWTTFRNGRTGPYTEQILYELLSTTDGGKTFRTITPPAVTHYPLPPPEISWLSGATVRCPLRPAFALQPPSFPPNDGWQFLFRAAVGGPLLIIGTGFRQQNTVWFGTHPVRVASADGEHLQLLVPVDVTPGTYKIYVENLNGKTKEAEVSIRAQQALRITNIQNGEHIHPGQQIRLSGTGFLLENEVWFGPQGVAAKLIISADAMLQVDVPASIPPGPCQVYVRNAAGKSDIVKVMVE
jgi:photosystem II stability/assembly factor-like uncharacterized protein